MELQLPQGQYYGCLKGTWTHNGLGFFEVEYAPTVTIPRHSHECTRCILILEGNVFHRAAQDVHCGPQTVVFVRENETHQDTCGDAGASCFIVEFDSGWNTLHETEPLQLDQLSFAGRDGRLAGLLHRVRQECLHSDSASTLIIEGLLLEAVGHTKRLITSCGPKTPAWLKRVTGRLDDDFRRRPTIRELAAVADVHPVHLCREFRARTGITIGEYIRQLRINCACLALSRTNRTIVEIALEAGFSSQAHFSTVFRRFTGFTPGAYRKAANANTAKSR
jgi:AraC family transcriptional regulator